jgi:Glycosyltransferase WbsX
MGRTFEAARKERTLTPRLVAFYLPQFHTISENNEWWGDGFTEWKTTLAGRPLFSGHYQPHVPADLGCYDLRQSDIRVTQAAMAASYGIDAFCYYHYWFKGKRLLETPFQEVFESGKPAFPFCLCWANEPWTRRYDGRSREVLMPQTYSEQDDIDHVRWLSRAFLDRRYLRVDSKALFLVYRGRNLPSSGRTIETWRKEARKLGAGELLICAVESNFLEERIGNPTHLGFDAAVEFQPDIFAGGFVRSIRTAFKHCGTFKVARCIFHRSQLRSYEHLAEASLAKEAPNYRRFPCVTPSWDNTARRQRGGALVYAGSTPVLYERWLRTTCEREIRNGTTGLVFINAWNEWGEGCHLEPDRRHGRAYLEGTLRAKNAPHPGKCGAAGREEKYGDTIGFAEKNR